MAAGLAASGATRKLAAFLPAEHPMNPIVVALALALAGAAHADTATTATSTDVQPFNVRDLVALDRVSDPRVSPDGTQVAFAVRETDMQANKGVHGVWLRALGGEAAPRRLTSKGANSLSPRWSADGRALYFLSSRSGSMQVWRLEIAGGEARQITDYPLDVGSFTPSPSGRQIAVSLEVFPDCADFACTKKRLDDEEASKPTGQLHGKIFIRHWDTWKNGTRSQLFVADLDANGVAEGAPQLVSRGIDGDVPSKPFGDDADYAWSPDGKSIVFAARIAGRTEPWSTNFDLFLAPADGLAAPSNLTAANQATDTGPVYARDGRTLYYRAMKRPGFEADRYAIMAMDLGSRQSREIAPDWDRSPDALAPSRDGRTLYAYAADVGNAPLFAIDVGSGKVTRLSGAGTVSAVSVGDDELVYALDTLKSPAQLHRLPLSGGSAATLTHFNAERLARIGMGDYEQFSFAGWNGETVHGYVVKPVGAKAGGKYPVAFLIHGGPQGSFGDHFHYRWNPQTYAGQGFAAVMIDFHGSTGYGQAFTDSISGDWGGKPLEDLQKGLAAVLAKYPQLDGARVCALGGSYGGFMANWIAGVWSDPFRCLVSHSGVFDNRMMGYSTEELWFDEWEMQGKPYEKPDNYERHNPVNHVAKWKRPMLVVHGQLDYRIPVEQGIAAFTALQSKGIASQFLYFPDENHWILKPHNSILWHDTVNAWLKRHLVDEPAR
jgi:dipeptidyl aminopeptidase/acylaminoacyl peptidase